MDPRYSDEKDDELGGPGPPKHQKAQETWTDAVTLVDGPMGTRTLTATSPMRTLLNGLSAQNVQPGRPPETQVLKPLIKKS